MADQKLNVIVSITDQFSKGLDAFSSKINAVGQKMQQTGTDLSARLTAPIVALGYAVVKTSADFEAAMNKVGALSGATGNDFDKLRDQAKELGATTVFSSSQAADAMGYLAMAGFKTNEIIGAMPSTLQLAAAANIDLGRAADITSNILTGYGLSVEDLGRSNDVLVKAFTSSNTDLVQLGEAFKYVGPVAKSAGVEFEETAAVLGMMSNAGIQSTMAGTSLRGAITRLLKPTKEVSDTLKKLGVNVLDSKGNLRSMTDIVKQLEESGASTADMMAIFGQRAGPAMTALVDQGSESLKNFTQKLKDSGGVAQSIADKQMAGFKGQMSELESALEGLLIAIGDSGVLGAFTRFALILTNIISSLTILDPGLVMLTTGFLTLLAALGPILVMVGNAVTLFGYLAAVFSFIAAHPIIIFLGALTAAGVLLYQNWETVSSVGMEVWSTLLTFFQGVAINLQGIFNQIKESIFIAMNSVFEFLKGTWSNISDFFKNIWDTIIGVFNFSVNFIVGLVVLAFEGMGLNLRATLTSISEFFSQIWEGMKSTVSGAFSFISSTMSVFLGNLKAAWEGAWNTVSSLVTTAWEGIKLVVSSGLEALAGLIQAAIGPIQAAFQAMWDNVTAVFKAALDGLKAMVDTVIGGILAAINSVQSAIGTVGNALGSVASAGAGFISGKRAAGGPVMPGQTYLVGEKGPELLRMGSQSGNIIPNHKLGGGGGGITVNLTVSGYFDKRGFEKIMDEVVVHKLRKNLMPA